MFPAALVAEFTPLSPQAQLAVVSLLAVGLLILAIRGHLRRSPPLDSELMKLSLAIEGLQVSFAKLNVAMESHATHASEIAALQDKVRTLEEHRENDQKGNRTYTRESSERIFRKLDELKDSVSANFQSIENRLGRVDGSIEQLTAQINRTRAPFG